MELKEYYTIGDLSRETGLTPLRIRTWENRYNILNPIRTITNIRQYQPEDLKKLLVIVQLLHKGEKISSIANLNRDELVELNTKKYDVPKANPIKDDFVKSIKDLDEALFNAHFKKVAKKFGFEFVLQEILFPILNASQDYWLTSDLQICQEQFIANLVRQKIVAQIESLKPIGAVDVSCVFFLPDYEQHEIGLLYIHYVLSKLGYKNLYLGTGLDLGAVDLILKRRKHSFLITTITSLENLKKPERLASQLRLFSKTAKVVVIGDQLLQKSANIFWCKSYRDVLDIVGEF